MNAKAIEVSRELKTRLDQQDAQRKLLIENLSTITLHECFAILEAQVGLSQDAVIAIIARAMDPARIAELNKGFEDA